MKVLMINGSPDRKGRISPARSRSARGIRGRAGL